MGNSKIECNTLKMYTITNTYLTKTQAVDIVERWEWLQSTMTGMNTSATVCPGYSE